MRKAAKTDANQQEIVDALRSHGATVLCLHSVGQGCPDLLVGWKNKNFLLEVKDGSKTPSQRKLTIDQRKFFSVWLGQVDVVNNVNEALKICEIE